ncbi:MAG: histidine kinase [Cytophagales bacterium]|nr:histidine kinase [Cytophagales bacterium]
MTQDRHGYLWIATAAGLNRFDGARFVPYPHRPKNPLTLPSNFIHDLCVDPHGTVWVATFKGIGRFVYEKDCFVRVPTVANTRISRPIPIGIAADAERLWVAYANGALCSLNLRNSRNGIYVHDTTVGKPMQLMADPDRKSLWVATTRGLYEFDINARKYNLRWKSASADGHREMIGALCKGHDGQLWLVSNGGELVRYQPQNQQAEVFPYILPDGENALSMPTGMTEGTIGASWYVAVTTRNGLVLFDPVTKRFRRQQQDDKDKQSLPANYLAHICTDRTGLLWVGSADGLAYAERTSANFTTEYLLSPDTEEEITALRPSRTKDRLWVGSSVSLKSYDTERHRVVFELPVPGKRKITALQEDDKQRVWVGTDRGLLVYDLARQKWLAVAKLGDAFADNPVTVIAPDKRGRHWIGTDKGIRIYDDQLRFVRNYSEDPETDNGMTGRYVNCIHTDAAGYTWVGTRQLLRYDPARQKFQSIRTESREAYFPNCIAEDARGNLWIGTGAGMGTFNLKKGTISFYDEDNSDVASAVFSMVVDAQQRPWLWSANSLYRFDPATGRSKIYRPQDGLVHQANGGQQLVPAPDGGFYIMLRKGFQYFHPQRIHQDTTRAPMVLSHLMIEDRFFTADANTLRDTVLELSYKQNMLCFQFSATDFHRSDETRYIYQLEGADKGWSSPVGSQMVTYPDLDDGEYTFRARARNYDGYWQPDELLVRVRILPPFWKTGWFLALCAGATLGLAYVVYRSRMNKVRREATLKIKALDAEIKALRAQLNPHFTFNSLTAIQNLILDEQNDLASGYLAKMARLMRFILTNSEKDMIPLHDEIELLRLYLEMESLRFDHSFTYEIRYNGQPASNTVMIPGMVFQPFVENAIWHGLMHREGKKTLSVTFAILPETKQIVGEVEDNGIGCKQALQNSIFSPHKSRGMELIGQRLAAAERQTGVPSRFEVIDLVDSEGQPAGTRIKVILPLVIEQKTTRKSVGENPVKHPS